TLSLFQKGDLDAALVPEPWGSRLIASVGARVVLDSARIYGGVTPSTVIVASASFLKAHPDVVVLFLRAHDELTRRLTPGGGSAAVAAALNAQIKVLTGKPLPPGVLASALSRTSFTTSISQGSLAQFAGFSVTAGYLRRNASIRGLIDPWPLAHLHDSSIK
ncbi:MAG TPA: ABC transporter substrate-binding protein, partial [Chloroflexota bacterium]|nr:ABC transporter substrate-binding protein [Chloroflexota bacterium]